MAEFTFSVQEILNRCFNAATDRLRAQGGGAGGAQAALEEQEIWNRVFDEAPDILKLGG